MVNRIIKLKKLFNDDNRLKSTFVISMIIHLLFIISSSNFKINLSDNKKSMNTFELQKLSKAEFELIKASMNKKQVKLKNQIVNNEERGREEKPQDSAFLGKKNQTYDRQTIAKNIDKFKVAGTGSRSGSKTRGKSLVNKNTPRIKLADLRMVHSTKSIENQINKKRGRELGSTPLGLKTGEEGVIGLSANNDYIEDVPLGDMTSLNTVEYKYYGFYHRIRQKLEQYWGYTLRKKANAYMKSGRRIASNSNKITSLTITLDQKGKILDIFVKSTSGIREFDDAAVESFNQAGPFPNPPKGLMKNGKAILEWGFVVKV